MFHNTIYTLLKYNNYNNNPKAPWSASTHGSSPSLFKP